MSKFMHDIIREEYVIYMRNPEPCEPENLFYSHLEQGTGNPVWCDETRKAAAFHSIEDAVETLGSLSKKYKVEIASVILSINTLEPESYKDFLANHKKRAILSKLTADEIAFLKQNGV